jgi:dihydroorotate dehydrogenase electron transfer subunit
MITDALNSQRHTAPRCAVRARVEACTSVCREHVLIELVTSEFPESIPGQFLELFCGVREDVAPVTTAWSGALPSLSDKDLRAPQPFLRRPFSIADRWTVSNEVHLGVISRAIGVGTRWLEQLKAGDTLDITGPLGHGFELPAQDTPLVLVGGGVGLPPLLYLTRHLHALGRRNVVLILGARSRDLLPVTLAAEPAGAGVATRCLVLPGDAPYSAIVASDDGSVGLHGWVTDGLRLWLDQCATHAAGPMVLACGPEGMLRGVATLTQARGVACQLCIERNMGCGLGTCLSCVVRVRDSQVSAGWRWALACQDGPVFARDDLLDYAPGAGT